MHLKQILTTLLAALTAIAGGQLQAQQQRESRQGLRQPIYRVAQAQPAAAQPAAAQPRGQNAHPIAPFVERAEGLLENMRKSVKDYSATLVKRERVDGNLLNHEYIFTKIRQEQRNQAGEVTVPFSVYMNFLAPDDVKGRECIYVAGANDGNLVAHEGGTGLLAAIKSSVTVTIDPESELAMKGNKYPITDVGMENLLKKLLVVAKEDMKHDEIKVDTFKGTKINGRVCTCVQSVHPVERDHFKFHIARIYIDDELQLPIRYESYGWPAREGDKPPLLEEYTYLNLKLNNGYGDRDFDKSNASYNFN